MSGVADSNARSATDSGIGRRWSKRVLLIASPAEDFPDCLVYAIEREFPSISVQQVSTLEAACTAFEHPVCLTLVDTEFLPEIHSRVGDLMRFHPGAPVVLVQHDNRTPVSVQDVFDLKIVRGVLPMDLKLDVWLSVIRLVLRGGEYFPFAMFQSYAKSSHVKTAAYSKQADQANSAETRFYQMGELTEREFQILEMVARGLQNKIIAATLPLSEHTVKIHLHNIITKLGVHNRTEAAAVFHERKGTFHGDADSARPSRFAQSSA
jgi:DNA-binding NarL/FixJ family response regulator